MWITSAGEREWTWTPGKRALIWRKSSSNQSIFSSGCSPPCISSWVPPCVDQFLDLGEDRGVVEDVGVGRVGLAVEGAEPALGLADVGVVDVAVDDEGHPPVRVLLPADRVGQLADGEQVGFGQQPEGLLAIDRGTPGELFLNGVKHRQETFSSR